MSKMGIGEEVSNFSQRVRNRAPGRLSWLSAAQVIQGHELDPQTGLRTQHQVCFSFSLPLPFSPLMCVLVLSLSLIHKENLKKTLSVRNQSSCGNVIEKLVLLPTELKCDPLAQQLD